MKQQCLMFAAVIGLLASSTMAAAILPNEWNAVSSDKYIKDGDTFFGSNNGVTDNRLKGNGGNWLELLVVDDHTDLRNWTLEWEEVGEASIGTITFADNLFWSDIRAGTIITLIETADGESNGAFDTSTDTSFSMESNDWWINICTTEEQAKGSAGLVSTVTNDGVAGEFSVGKSDWQITIKDNLGATVFGPIGEALWTSDAGVGSDECGGLEGPAATATLADWQAITVASLFFDDTGGSSFGQINCDFVLNGNVVTWEPEQDVSALRAQAPEPTTMILLGMSSLTLLRRRQN